MRKFNKYDPEFIGLGLLAVYLVTRLYNLLMVPIFTDEAIYVRWTQIFRSNFHQFFISLTDGKQPLFIWFGTLFLHLTHDPLFDVRLVSVVSGLITMIGIYYLTNEVFGNKKSALIASALYVIFPIAIVYDKLALYDSMLATFAVWSLYLEIRLVKNLKFRTAFVTALVIGGGLLTKSSAWFFLYLLPFSLVLFNFRSKNSKRDLIKWGALALFVTAGAYACYSILRFSPNFHYITDKNYTFVYPIKVWIKHPLSYLPANTPLVLRGLTGYTTIPFLILTILSFAEGRKYLKEKILLLIWFMVPFSLLDLFGNSHYLFPRYILFMLMPLLPLAAHSVIWLFRQFRTWFIPGLICVLLLAPMVYKDFNILTDFNKADIPISDRKQLISGYASGVGVDKTVDFLKQKSQHQKIYVGTEGIYGLMPEALQDYLNGNSNITISSYWPITQYTPQTLLQAAKIMPTYFVFYAPCPSCSQTGIAPKTWLLKTIFQIKKLDKGTYYTLYQVLPQ